MVFGENYKENKQTSSLWQAKALIFNISASPFFMSSSVSTSMKSSADFDKHLEPNLLVRSNQIRKLYIEVPL